MVPNLWYIKPVVVVEHLSFLALCLFLGAASAFFGILFGFRGLIVWIQLLSKIKFRLEQLLLSDVRIGIVINLTYAERSKCFCL